MHVKILQNYYDQYTPYKSTKYILKESNFSFESKEADSVVKVSVIISLRYVLWTDLWSVKISYVGELTPTVTELEIGSLRK